MCQHNSATVDCGEQVRSTQAGAGLRPARRQVLLGAAALLGGAAGPVAGAASASADIVPSAGDSRYRVTHYEIGDTILTYASATTRIHGATTLTCVTRAATTTLKLDFAMRPSKAELSVDGGITWRTVTISGINPAQGYRRFFVSGFSLARGQAFKLRIRYDDNPRTHAGNDHGLYMGDTRYFGVSGEPLAAEHWFPCNNRLTDKSTYSISISTQVSNQVLAMNPVSALTFTGSSGPMRNVQFRLNEPSTPYQLGVAVGPFSVTSGTWNVAGRNVPYHLATMGPSTAVLAKHTPQTLNYFAARYGAFPFSHTGATVMDTFDYCMETVGAPTYRPTSLRPSTIAHENAHMWFGNCITATNWRDLLLFHEGLATLLEDDYTKVFAPGTYQWVKPALYTGETVNSLSPTFQVTAAQYRIAAGLMRQVRIEMDGTSNEANAPRFRALLRDLATGSHRYGNITRTDFKTLANKHASRDMSTFFAKYAF